VWSALIRSSFVFKEFGGVMGEVGGGGNHGCHRRGGMDLSQLSDRLREWKAKFSMVRT